MALLRVENVCKSFFGNLAVDHASLNVEEKSITALIGANGAGKTTLFNCISGYYPSNGGEIYFEDKPVHHLSAQKLCKKGIARTFQIAKPFGDLTVLENAVVGGYNQAQTRAQAYEYAKESLVFVGLEEKSDTLAYLLNTGEQRKLELARALATKPKLILLDEVMAGLTPSESVEMVGLIKQIRDSGVTILMIEHVMPVIMGISDVIYVLDRGKMIASGTPEEVASNEEVITSYLGKGME
ncbi:MAG: ABC transporter ATP-binding protein [Lachnospiraceae bacterium]|nr:ABC transporter ATP-binding protein [Lachnospiraceae bacterium]